MHEDPEAGEEGRWKKKKRGVRERKVSVEIGGGFRLGRAMRMGRMGGHIPAEDHRERE